MKKTQIIAICIIALHFAGYSQKTTSENSNTLKQTEKYIYSGKLTRKESRKKFKDIKILAETGNAEAICMLGILYKDGIGTSLNFNKARKQFKKAYELGDDKAAYSLGYLYLKGLGTIDQDYKKAKKWFERSNYPMAKHWLAKMYYFGFGVEIDRIKAKDILRENQILNSQVLLYQFENYPVEILNSTQLPKEDGEMEQVAKDAMEQPVITSNFNGTIPASIEGNWNGYLIEMDWSGKKMLRTIPLDMTIGGAKDDFGTVDSQITIGTDSISSGSIWSNGTLTLFDAKMAIQKQYTDHPYHTSLDYDLLSVSFSQRELDGNTFLIGNLETQVLQWSEPGPPMMLILAKGELVLSQEILDAFADQADSFVKLYPNPFVNNLLVYYDLRNDANVSVSIHDYYGQTQGRTIYQGFQKAGGRSVSLNNLPLNNGLYVVKVQVNGELHTKLVIKK